MTSPNIEMIASSLRHCSLNGGGGGRRSRARRRAEGTDDSEGVTVELNSEVALPYHWQQCLDIRTGQVYYINWEDGTRTTVDPRTSSPFSSSPTPRSTPHASPRAASTSSSGASGYTSASSVGAVTAAAWFSGAGYGSYGYNDSDGYNEGDDEESSSSSAGSSQSSAVSSFSPTDESASSGSGSESGNGNNAVHVLVAAGCRACFMYFMVPKSTGVCPKCGTPALLYLGRSGSNNNNAYAA